MKTGAGIAIGLSVALAAGGGYWLGQRPVANHSEPSVAAVTAPVEGMKKERKLLYYRNPMGLPDTSPTPKKDPMGMDYVPVYEGEADGETAAANSIKISTEKVQKLGVRTEAAELRALDKQVRAAGRIEIDAGAETALASGKSLLPAGVRGVWGTFSRGDTVSIYGTNGREIARGLAGYDADEARLIVGKKSAEIAAILGYAGRAAMVHRDDLVVTAVSEAGKDLSHA